MRLLSRLLRQPASDVPPRPAPGDAAEPPAALDDALRDLLRRCVNSPIKLDLVLHLHDNPYAMDDARGLALRLGREIPLIEACAAELARDGVLARMPGGEGGEGAVFRLARGSDVAAAATRLASFCKQGGTPDARAVIRDTSAVETVRSAIAASGRLSALHLVVCLSGREVLLSGRVNTPGERAELDVLCERLSQSRYGIRAIENRVEVVRQAGPSDGHTGEQAQAALGESGHLVVAEAPPDTDAGALYVEVEVIGSVAYLTGLVSSPEERQRAVRTVQGVAGVLDVVNWIDVQSYRGR